MSVQVPNQRASAPSPRRAARRRNQRQVPSARRSRCSTSKLEPRATAPAHMAWMAPESSGCSAGSQASWPGACPV